MVEPAGEAKSNLVDPEEEVKGNWAKAVIASVYY